MNKNRKFVFVCFLVVFFLILSVGFVYAQDGEESESEEGSEENNKEGTC